MNNEQLTIYQLPITNRQSKITNYAKQTQFAECSNEHKVGLNKVL
jgi:hypothetical protein